MHVKKYLFGMRKSAKKTVARKMLFFAHKMLVKLTTRKKKVEVLTSKT